MSERCIICRGEVVAGHMKKNHPEIYKYIRVKNIEQMFHNLNIIIRSSSMPISDIAIALRVILMTIDAHSASSNTPDAEDVLRELGDFVDMEIAQSD